MYPYMLGTSQLAVSVVLVVLLLWRIPVAPLCRDQGEGAPSSSIGSRRIAVVAPFIAAEIDAVEANLLTWTRFSPCSDAVRNNHSTDLVFYFHRDLQHAPAIVSRLKKVIAAVPAADRCFGHVSFLSALLTPEEDRYPAGASLMFFKLFDFYRLQKDYDYIYLMEADNRPCRSGWLDQLRRDVSSSPWISGGIRRDGVEVGGKFSDHINGNALYNIGDHEFRSFIAKVHDAFRRDSAQYLESYDIALHLVRLDRSMVAYKEYAAMHHRFVYSPTMQNWYRTSVNATELCSASPETFLVHGRYIYF